MREEMEALAEKYRALARLRERREEVKGLGRMGFEEEEGRARRAEFRRVAQRFPGSLRELDTTPADVFREKLALVEAELAALDADPTRAAPSRRWIAVVLDFHATLREALAIKLWLARRVGRDGVVSDDVLREFLAWHAAWPHRRGALGPVDARFLERHHHPPRGRVLSLVWEALEARHHLSRAALERAVFGPPAEEPS